MRTSRVSGEAIFYVTLFLGSALYWNWITRSWYEGQWVAFILYFLIAFVSLILAAIVSAFKNEEAEETKSFHRTFTITYIILTIWFSLGM